MATVKNFGLAGVGSEVQYGKGGGKLKYTGTHFEVLNAAGTTEIETYGKTPTGSSDARTLTTKEYVDSVATGLDFKNSVVASTTADLGTVVYDNVASSPSGLGATLTGESGGSAVVFTIDGITPALNDRVLVKNQAAALQNGIYTITTLGVAGSIAWVLTRAIDADNSPGNEVSGGMFAFIEDGTTLSDTGWVLSTPVGNASLGADSLVFTQFSSAGLTTVSGTTGRITAVQTGNDWKVDIDTGYVGQTSITTLGTIGTGVWQGTTIAIANGGTGKTALENVTAGTGITLGGTPAASVVNAFSITVDQAALSLQNIGGDLDLATQVGVSILPHDNGGTGSDTNLFAVGSLAGWTAGGVAEIPDVAVGNALISGGSGVAPTYGKIGLSTHVSGILPHDNGGTGTDTNAFLQGSLAVWNSGTNVAEIADIAVGNVLLSGGISANPSYGKVGLTTHVSGTLPVANGGTGATTLTDGGVLLGAGTGPVEVTAVGAAGTLLRGTGANPAFTTLTMPATIAAESIFVANAANTLVELTVAASGDQLLQWNDGGSYFEFVTTASVGGNKFTTIAGDTGTTVADSGTDTVTLVGGSGITTTAEDTGDTVTFDLDIDSLTGESVIDATNDYFAFFDDSAGANRKATAQEIVDAATVNIFTTITGDTGSATVDNETDTLNFTGGEGIVTVASDTPDRVTISLDLNEISVAVPIAGDHLVFADGGSTNGKVTITNFLADFDIVNSLGGNGLAVQTAADTYTNRSIAVSAVAGDEGLSVVDGDGVAGNPTVGLDIFGLTANSANLLAADRLAVYNGTNNRYMTGTEIADGVSTLLALDDSRITDGDDTYVDTDLVSNTVTINTKDAATAATQTLASFYAAGSTATDANFEFTNEDSVTTGGNDEIQITAAGTVADIDIRLSPKGAGEVIFGAPGAAATISASSGAIGEDMIILAGDGTGGAGGDITLTPGTGTTTDGKVCITDDDSVNVMCFEGVDTAVNYISLTNAITGGSPVFAVEGEANINMKFLGAGTGVLTVTGTTNYEVQVTDDDDIPNKKYVDDSITSGNQNIWLNITGDSGTTAADITTDTLTIAGGTSITTSVSGDTLTITNDDPNVDQNIWLNVAGDSGTTAASTTSDTLTVTGAGGITTSVAGSTLTITAPSGTMGSYKFTVPLNANGNTDPASSTIPAGATVLRAYINVIAADSGATFTVGTTSGGAEYAADTTNDPSSTGLYVADLFSGTVGDLRGVVAGANGTPVASAVANAGGTGYTNGDVVTVAGGTVGAGGAATFTATVVAGAITALVLLSAGGYQVGPSLTANAVTGGTGTGATIDITMGSAGSVDVIVEYKNA